MSKVIAHLMRTPDGTILRSYHVHDYVTYTDKNGKQYMIDGGAEYCRRSANGDEMMITISTDNSFDIIRKYFCWGTRGKDGKQPIKYVALMSLESDHIQAILDTQKHITKEVRNLFETELEYRYE